MFDHVSGKNDKGRVTKHQIFLFFFQFQTAGKYTHTQHPTHPHPHAKTKQFTAQVRLKQEDCQTCQGFPRSAGRRAGPDGAGGGSAPGRSRPTSERWGPSLPRRTSSERLELARVDKYRHLMFTATQKQSSECGGKYNIKTTCFTSPRHTHKKRGKFLPRHHQSFGRRGCCVSIADTHNILVCCVV